MSQTSIYTNSPGEDQVLRPFTKLISSASYIRLAAPYFTVASEIVEAAQRGATIELLIGLNPSTNPSALNQVMGYGNVSIRYFTDNFHAKVFLFDSVAMLGSANLTHGGMTGNREAVILLDQPGDEERIQDIEAFFAQVWDGAEVLTRQVYLRFKEAWTKASLAGNQNDPFKALEPLVPAVLEEGSGRKSSRQLFLGELQKTIYEEYRPAFDEVTTILREQGYRRPEFEGLPIGVEVNRFLNWVRLEKVKGDAAWQDAQIKSASERQALLLELGHEWATTDDPRMPDNYLDLITTLTRALGTEESIRSCDRAGIYEALACVHAFHEQLRFTKGGADGLSERFWESNLNDLERVQNTLIHLVHGSEDFAVRICDVLYNPRYRIRVFGRFCALELAGTLNPHEAPPINGRMAKSLKYLGFKVRV